MSNVHPSDPVEIVICVHNGCDDVDRCLRSVMTTMRETDRIIIVDDGSDTETMLLCQQACNEIGPRNSYLLRRPSGSGFCKAANAGLELTSYQTVIILNSDTIVTGDWIERMTTAMSSNPDVGIVGPLSNAGGWQSVPELPDSYNTDNSFPCDIKTVSEMHDFCKNLARPYAPPIVEQVNGFCFAVSREVLSLVGHFDEINFPMGYGEENDLTFRAMNAGFLCLVAIDCFVYHAKTKSYTKQEKTTLGKLGLDRLYKLHGKDRVVSSVKQTQEHSTLKLIRSKSQEFFWIKDG